MRPAPQNRGTSLALLTRFQLPRTAISYQLPAISFQSSASSHQLPVTSFPEATSFPAVNLPHRKLIAALQKSNVADTFNNRGAITALGANHVFVAGLDE
jgi:hypothetical protein